MYGELSFQQGSNTFSEQMNSMSYYKHLGFEIEFQTNEYNFKCCLFRFNINAIIHIEQDKFKYPSYTNSVSSEFLLPIDHLCEILLMIISMCDACTIIHLNISLDENKQYANSEA